MDKPIYNGMLILAGRKQTERGDMVCFWLDKDYDEHPFKDYRTDSSGPTYGAMFAAAIVRVGDDGETLPAGVSVSQNTTQDVKPKDNDIVRCAICCKSKDFHQYLKVWIGELDRKQKADMAYSLPRELFRNGYKSLDGPLAEDLSRHVVYWWCGISSRAELRFNPRANKAWRELEQKFYRWRSERERHANQETR